MEEEAGLSTINLSPRAGQLLTRARKEAEKRHHNYISTEHLLLGLTVLKQGVAVNVLRGLGLNLKSVRAEVEKLAGVGAREEYTGKTVYAPQVKKVLVFAKEEAAALHHTYIGTEHLLLGLLRDYNSISAQTLKNFDVDIDKIKRGIFKELGPH